MSSGDCLTSLQSGISDAINSKTWVRVVDYLVKLKEWFIKVLKQEKEVEAKKKYKEMFMSLKNQINVLANHACIMLPRLNDNKTQFKNIENFLKSEIKDGKSCISALNAIQHNLEGLKALDEHRKETGELYDRIAQYQNAIQGELDKIENILSSKPIKHKKTAAAIAGAVGGASGAAVVSTLIGIEALGGCGHLIIAGTALTAPLMGVAVASGAAIGFLLLGIGTFAILCYIKHRNSKKHSLYDELNEDLLTLVQNTNELHRLLETSYTNEKKIEYDMTRIKRALEDETQREANKNVCAELISDNENLSDSFNKIIQLRDSLSSLNFME